MDLEEKLFFKINNINNIDTIANNIEDMWEVLNPYSDSLYCKNCDGIRDCKLISIFPPESEEPILKECSACKTRYTMQQVKENYVYFMKFHEWYDKFRKPLDKKRGEEIANKAQAEFERVAKGGLPDDIKCIEVVWENDNFLLPNILKKSGMVESTSDARRLIKQGAVSVDDKKITDINTSLNINSEQYLIKIGKRRFKKILIKEK